MDAPQVPAVVAHARAEKQNGVPRPGAGTFGDYVWQVVAFLRDQRKTAGKTEMPTSPEVVAYVASATNKDGKDIRGTVASNFARYVKFYGVEKMVEESREHNKAAGEGGVVDVAKLREIVAKHTEGLTKARATETKVKARIAKLEPLLKSAQDRLAMLDGGTAATAAPAAAAPAEAAPAAAPAPTGDSGALAPGWTPEQAAAYPKEHADALAGVSAAQAA